MIDTNFIVMLAGVILTGLGICMGIILWIKSIGIFRKAISFLILGLLLSFISHLIELLGINPSIFGNYDYFYETIHVLAIASVFVSLLIFKKMIDKIEKDLKKKKISLIKK